MRWASAAACAALAALSIGCNEYASCDRSADGNPLVRYTEGTVDGGVYMTAPWDGELLYFPGGMRYALEHKLGRAPRWWQVYLSFDQYGTETGTLALAAGNQAEVIGVDDKEIDVVNGSCSDYWMLAVASAGEYPDELPPNGE